MKDSLLEKIIHLEKIPHGFSRSREETCILTMAKGLRSGREYLILRTKTEKTDLRIPAMCAGEQLKEFTPRTVRRRALSVMIDQSLRNTDVHLKTERGILCFRTSDFLDAMRESGHETSFFLPHELLQS